MIAIAYNLEKYQYIREILYEFFSIFVVIHTFS